MKQCKKCQSSFEVTDFDRQFYRKMDVPEPTLCPDCRKQRQLAWRNERSLYKRSCDLCGKSNVSIYSPDKQFQVYCHSCWWGDKWDTLSFGRDFDFSRPFFEQFKELQSQVPRLMLINSNSENSEYTNHSTANRNCYMGCDIGNCEDVYYSNWIVRGKNIMDCTKTVKSQICYQCLDCFSMYSSFYCQECENCSDGFFLFDCKDCRNCIACTGLRNKENYLFNEPASSEKIKEVRGSLGNYQNLQSCRRRFDELKLNQPRVYMRRNMSENVSGEFVEKCKDVFNSYLIYEARDCNFITESSEMNDSFDVHSMWEGEKLYEFHAGVRVNNSIATNKSDDSNDIFYCDNVFNSEYCFGSVGLNHNKYCILNKQYSKEEYEKLVPRIIEHMKNSATAESPTGEWGEFFPASFSPFAYNETIANQYFPLTKEEAVRQGLKWTDQKDEKPKVDKIIPASRLPDDIRDIPDDILNWAAQCEISGRPFRIVPQELRFYRGHDLPVPHLHPDERYKARVALRNPRKLFDRKCDKCNADIRTSYCPDRPEKVYCEQCYLKEVY